MKVVLSSLRCWSR